MITLMLRLLRLLPLLCGAHRHVALENLALRHQLAVYGEDGVPAEGVQDRPTLLGRAVEGVGRLEAGSRHRVPQHRSAVAAAPLLRALDQASPLGPSLAAHPSMLRSRLS